MKTKEELAIEYCINESLPYNEYNILDGDYGAAFIAGYEAAESRIKELEEKLLLATGFLHGITMMPHMDECECDQEIDVTCVNCYLRNRINEALEKIKGMG